MTQQRARNIAWLCFGLTLLSIPVSLVVLVRVAHTPFTTQDWWNVAGSFVGAAAFCLVARSSSPAIRATASAGRSRFPDWRPRWP